MRWHVGPAGFPIVALKWTVSDDGGVVTREGVAPLGYEFELAPEIDNGPRFLKALADVLDMAAIEAEIAEAVKASEPKPLSPEEILARAVQKAAAADAAFAAIDARLRALEGRPPAPAPQAVQPTSEEAVSVPPSGEPLTSSGGGAAYAGTMLQEDRENYLRGVISVRITEIKRDRLNARFDPSARARQIKGFTDYNNLAGRAPIPENVQAAYDEFMAAEPWVQATKQHAEDLYAAAATVPLEMLEKMVESIEEGWP